MPPFLAALTDASIGSGKPSAATIQSKVQQLQQQPQPQHGRESGPQFLSSVPNVTVAVGRDAVLPCVVKNLMDYKV